MLRVNTLSNVHCLDLPVEGRRVGACPGLSLLGVGQGAVCLEAEKHGAACQEVKKTWTWDMGRGGGALYKG